MARRNTDDDPEITQQLPVLSAATSSPTTAYTPLRTGPLPKGRDKRETAIMPKKNPCYTGPQVPTSQGHVHGMKCNPARHHKLYLVSIHTARGRKISKKIRAPSSGWAAREFLESLDDDLELAHEGVHVEEIRGNPGDVIVVDPKPNPIIELEPTAWVRPDDLDGNHLRWNRWEDRKTPSATIPIFVIDGAAGSDYVGGLVAKSNYQTFEKMAEEESGLERFFIWLSGGHGTFGVAVRLDRGYVPSQILDAISALANYPLLDEEAHSHLELEAEQEAWDSWARDDWRKALMKAHPEHEEAIEDFSDEELSELWREASDAAGVYVEHTAEGPYFDFKRAAGAIELE